MNTKQAQINAFIESEKWPLWKSMVLRRCSLWAVTPKHPYLVREQFTFFSLPCLGTLPLLLTASKRTQPQPYANTHTKMGNSIWTELFPSVFHPFSSPLPSLPHTGTAAGLLPACVPSAVGRHQDWDSEIGANYCHYHPRPKQPQPRTANEFHVK